nr:unnamed protein product [Spirometra erinaceieuropaei]
MERLAGDFDQMRVDLSGLDCGSLSTGNANDDWEPFKNVFLQLINNHCPLTSEETKPPTVEPLTLSFYDKADKAIHSASSDSSCRSEHSLGDLTDNVDGESEGFGEQSVRKYKSGAADSTAVRDEVDEDNADDAGHDENEVGTDVRSCELSNESDLDLSTVDEATEDAEHSGLSRASFVSPQKSTPAPPTCVLKEASAANDGVQTRPAASGLSVSPAGPEPMRFSSRHRLYMAASPDSATTGKLPFL